jgi:hypothetical protein
LAAAVAAALVWLEPLQPQQVVAAVGLVVNPH